MSMNITSIFLMKQKQTQTFRHMNTCMMHANMENDISSYHDIMSSRVTVFARLAKISDGVNAINTICKKPAPLRSFELNLNLFYLYEIYSIICTLLSDLRVSLDRILK